MYITLGKLFIHQRLVDSLEDHRMLTLLLLLKSLNDKWYKGSSSVVSWECPFCKMYYLLINHCEKCPCPKEICDKGGRVGYIRSIDKYRVMDMEEVDLNYMIGLFQKNITRLKTELELDD